MENLIDNAHTLFDEYLPPSSPPLPPAPTDKPVPPISYGSSHAKVALPPSGEAPGADFTPELPSRPTASIHPSTRYNPPMSPTRLGTDPSAFTTPAPLVPLLPPRIQTTTEAIERPTREQVVSNTRATEVVEKAPGPPQPPPTAGREQHQGEQQLAAVSAPGTPLTASSLTGSLSFSD
jgi:hypothetical protein